MKLSELKFEMAVAPDRDHFSMHSDASDVTCCIYDQETLDEVRKELMDKYGDVEIIVDPNAVWYDVVKIVDEKWKEAHRKYVSAKSDWCSKYGCD